VYLCIAESLRAAGFAVASYQDNLPSFGDWGWHVATPNGTDADLLTRVRAVERFAVGTTYLTPQRMHASFVFGKGELPDEPSVRPNTKMRPVITAYYAKGFH
jgi:spermidine synthase